MYVFPILEWNFKVPNLKLKPQSQKHTFYFFNFGIPKSKAYILHCKMHVFSKFGMKFQGSKPEIEAPILKWNFKIPSLKLKPQSQKYTFYTVKCMFLEGQLLEDKTLMHFFCQFLAISGKTYILLFQMCVKKSMLFWRCFWGLPKKCVIQRVVFWEAQAGQGLGSGRSW